MPLCRDSKIRLLLPNLHWYGKRSWLYIPYTALILTALLKKEFDFGIIDANSMDLSEEDTLAELKRVRPDIVLLSGLSTEYYHHYRTASRLAKTANPEVITIFGGIFPTLLSEEALADTHIDYIFIGHAEERITDFLKFLLNGAPEQARNFPGIGYRGPDGNPVINPFHSSIANVKHLVKPDYSLIDVNAYYRHQSTDYNTNSGNGSTAVLLTSFGCPYNCMFCATRSISGRGVIFRPTEDILAEIDFLMQNYGIKNLSFFDECFLADRERVETILGAFINRKYDLSWKMPNASAWHLDDSLLELMKRSGCTQITISVESGSERVLRQIIHKPLKLEIIPGIIKKCRELGIYVLANFVIGLPGETWDEIRRTFRVAEEFDFDLAAFHIATPYPKTDLYRVAREQDLLPPDFNFLDPRFFGTSQGFITTDEFTPFELMILRSFEWDRINFSTPEKIATAAKLMNISIEQLNYHRKQTRLKCGVYSPEIDKTAEKLK
jgi:radical SAM superfamily enzyme YgiQ (UPF0313 family)